MSASSSDLLSALDALSPVDGRYRAASAPLRGLLTEGGLIRERIRIEALWLLHLAARSEEHTSELQSQSNLVCRLLLEKKKCRVRRRLLRSVFSGKSRSCRTWLSRRSSLLQLQHWSSSSAMEAHFIA